MFGAGTDASPGTDEFDNLVRVAKQYFSCPAGFICILDDEEPTLGRCYGLVPAEGYNVDITAPNASFCQAIIDENDVLVVEDASLHPRFKDNVLVIAYPSVRFFMGAPITGPSDQPIGAICVYDYTPRGPQNASAVGVLKSLARFAGMQVERVQHARARAMERSQFDRVAASSAVMVLEVDADGRISWANQAARLALSARADTLSGASISDHLLGWSYVIANCERQIASVAKPSMRPVLVELMDSDYSLTPMLATVSSFFSTNGLRYRVVLQPLS
ncbi:GAF domain-containing protein [Acuticoccus mangrovi]|uniref:GAF domain-containing protein n=1 Tax=Acuticoccus mangrovi TaxID=2796142 RepID=A0A934MF47_9HYPH|nr:GAF domain-containing protein [Acuticoccus mangrovi]MBJ3778272.1 GAF domain-containing protein [Acuticoccus mangrovi]